MDTGTRVTNNVENEDEFVPLVMRKAEVEELLSRADPTLGSSLVFYVRLAGRSLMVNKESVSYQSSRKNACEMYESQGSHIEG
jgi:hypothetical protein